MVALTGCDAVMIGRAAPANPWIFRQIAQYTASGMYERPTVNDRYRMIHAYFQMLLDEAEATRGLPRDARMGAPADRSSSAGKETAGKMKQFATWFTHGVPGGAKLRAAIYQARTGPEVLAQVELFFTASAADDSGSGRDPGADSDSASHDLATVFPEAATVCD
jgi:tRNA-dihydrouridine synthase